MYKIKESIKSNRGRQVSTLLLWMLIVTNLVLVGLYIKEKRQDIEYDRFHSSGSGANWEWTAKALAEVSLDIPDYVHLHELDRNRYSDREIIEHFITIGLPKHWEYRLNNRVDEARKIHKFWEAQLEQQESHQ